MKILFFSILSILMAGSMGISSDIFAAEYNQICIGNIWIENTKGKIACVTPSTAEKLVERGWGILLDGAEEKSKMTSSDTDQEITALKSQIEVLQQKVNQYELEQTTVAKNLALFDELDLIAFNNRDMERIAEIHMPDVKVINRDGKITEPFDPDHKDELLFLFETFPDFSINEHPIGFGQGDWTAGLSISTGTFLNPMELPDGTIIEPTGESFEVRIVTLAKWQDGRIVEEYLMWDNEDWMKQLGIAEKLVEQTLIQNIHPEKMKTSSPLPESANGPQVDFSKGYFVEEIKDGLYWVTDSAYNTMFLTTGEGVIVIDAPPSIGENYLKAIAEVTEEPVTHVIYSHTHVDHVGSIGMFPDDAIYIAHQDAADTLTQRNDPNRPIPTVTFEDKYILEVGNKKLELDYHGPMHEPGNIFIYAPDQKVLMAVDLIYPGWIPFKDLAMAHDVPAFLASHEKVLEYDFETFVGGHVNRLGTVEDVLIQQEYFEDIQNAATKANQDNSYVAVGQEVGFENPWLVVQIWADAITQQCTDEVVPKWIDRLGGADLFTYDHCWKVSESQRIDG